MQLKSLTNAFIPVFTSNTTTISGQKNIIFGIGKNSIGEVNIAADAAMFMGLQGKDAIRVSKMFAINACYNTKGEIVEQSFIDNVSGSIVTGNESLLEHLYANYNYAQARAITRVLISEPSEQELRNYEATKNRQYGQVIHRESSDLLSWSLAKEFFIKQLGLSEGDWTISVELLRDAVAQGIEPKDYPAAIKDFVGYFLQVLAISKATMSAPKFKIKSSGAWIPYSTEKGIELFGETIWVNQEAGVPLMEERLITTKPRTSVGTYKSTHKMIGQVRETNEQYVNCDGEVIVDVTGSEATYAAGSVIEIGQVALVVNYDANDVIEKKVSNGAHKGLEYPTESEVAGSDTSGFIKYEAPEYQGMLLSATTTDGVSGNLKGSNSVYLATGRGLVLYSDPNDEMNVVYTLLNISTEVEGKSEAEKRTVYFLIPHRQPLLTKSVKGLSKK